MNEDVKSWKHVRVYIACLVVNLAERTTAHAKGHIMMGAVTDHDMFFLDEEELFEAFEVLEGVDGLR